MTDETTPVETPVAESENFAEFEQSLKPKPVEAESPKAPEPDDDTLELGPDDVATDDQVKEEKRKRSKQMSQRISELSAKNREKDDQLASLNKELTEIKQRLGMQPPAEAVAPDPAKYEFGEADPKYLSDLTDFKVSEALKQRDQNRAKEIETQQDAEKKEAVARDLNTAWNDTIKDDPALAEKIEKATEERVIFTPLVSLGVSAVAKTEPAKAKAIAEYLIDNPADADALVKAETEFATIRDELNRSAQAALKAGTPPEFVDTMTKAALKPYFQVLSDKFDAIEQKAGTGETVVKPSKAPDPPQQRARGASGKFSVDDDTEDFASFEKKYKRR